MTTIPPQSDVDALRTSALITATNALSSRVQNLADAVQTNNSKLDILQGEVNKKPDDVEVKFITGMAKDDRDRVRNAGFAAAIVSALVAGGVAFGVANEISEDRCEDNRAALITITDFLETISNHTPTVEHTIDKLNELEEHC